MLARVVAWDAAMLSKELPDLEILAEFKYDEYGQFSPGMRFTESLSTWLGQFEGSEQEAMYGIVRDRLVFVSNAEMRHFIKMAYPDHIKLILAREVARRAGACEDHVASVVGSKEFSDLERRGLYLGLSDGSKMDDFRRFSNLGHKQVYSVYEIEGRRRGKMMEKLKESLGPGSGDPRFEIVFLIDDFSASGLSYIRERDGRFKGKIKALIDQFCLAGEENRPDEGRQKGGGLGDMFAQGLLSVVLSYTTKDRAAAHIGKYASRMFGGYGVRAKVVVVHEMFTADTSTACRDEDAAESILEKKFDSAVLTDSYKAGKHQKAYRGFDECGLLVVLSHNCPNNTLPTIWHESNDRRIRTLFLRHQRFAGE